MSSVAEEIAALRGTRRATLKDLFTNRSFTRLWRAMLVSSLGDWVGFVAVASLVARLGGERLGGLAVAGVMLARLLPSVVFGPFAGVVADRFDRRKVMVGADLARGALYASLPLVPDLWAIFLMSFLIECLSLLWTPARDAAVPNLVPRRQLTNANSISLATTYGTLPIGATIYTTLAGVATEIPYLKVHPESLALWLDALTFFFSARMVSRLVIRTPGRQQVSLDGERFGVHTALVDVRQGWRFLRSHPLIRSMTLGIVIAFAGAGSVMSLGPVFARYTVHAGSTGFGLLMIALGIGMGAGMGLLGLMGKFFEKDRLHYSAIFLSGASLFIIASMPTIELAALFTLPMGAGAGLAWVSGYTMLQENVSDEFRGRTFATLTITARLGLFVALAGFPALATPLGKAPSPLGGALDATGSRQALWIGALLAITAGMISRRGLRRASLARPRPLGLLPRLRKSDAPGRLIAFEGVEGSGKGTQIELARAYLRSRGREVLVTREPGGTQFGDRLRETILDPTTGKVDARAEALVFAASRAHLVSTVIRPALSEGKVVLCDRFVDSSVAYQGAARGLGEQDILTLNAWATQGLFPDLVILLHLEPEQGLARSAADPDRIESEDLAFHSKVSDAYLRIAEEHPERFAVIDAAGGEEDVHKLVCQALDRVVGPDLERGGAT